ncbi:putative ribonuclease H-like domain-containing protein [Tanacetum coccineum]
MFIIELLDSSPSMNYIPVRKENYADSGEKVSTYDDVEDLDDQQFIVHGPSINAVQNKHSEERTADKEVPLSSEEQALHDELVSLMHQESLAKSHNDAQRNAFEKEKRRIALEKGKECVDSTFTLSTANTPSQSTGNTPTDSDDDVPKDGVFSTNSFDDENTDTEEGGAADYNNMDPTIDVTSTPTLRIHKNHPQSQIIGKSTAGILTRRKLKESASDQHQALLSFIYKQNRTNHKDQQTCLFACFLSQEEPKKVAQALANEIAQGYRQGEGVDYDEFFAPVARIKAIRLFLAFASFMGFTVYQMDVKSAFLYGNITEEVYVKQPPGFEDPAHPNKVYRVVKALYGLHQAPRACYVENIFLDLPISMVKDLKILMQRNARMSVRTIKPASTPIEAHKSLGKDEEGEEVDVHLYRSMIGCLMYLTASRPDIMFAVCLCARFQVTPKVSHMHAVKRIFRYLKHQPKLGLWYPKDSPFHLEAFSDSDYAGDNHDRRSTSGGCQYLGRRLVSWQCKKQTIVAISSTEAEYVAAASCCAQTEHNADFHQIIDYLAGCSINYSLLVDPDLIEETIRADLLFDDADGVDCFPNPQWKYLVHVLLHCLSPKSTSWEQFGTNIASALHSPKFSCRITPLTPPMLEVVTALAAEEAHSTSSYSRAASPLRDAQGTPAQSAAQDSSLQGTADLQRTAEVQGTDASQGTAEAQGTADILKSPNDYTPTDSSQTCGGDEGLLDLYALKREVRRLKKQTLSQAKQIHKLKAKLKKLSKLVQPVVKHHAFWVESQNLKKRRKKQRKKQRKKVSSVKLGRNKDASNLSEENNDQDQDDFVYEDVDAIEAVVTPDLERKSDETEEVLIEEEKDASDVKSGDTEELDLERIQSTARQSTVTPRTLDFDDEAGPSSPIRPTQEEEPEEQFKDDEFLANLNRTRGLSIPGPMQSQPQQPTQASDPKEKGKGILVEEPKKKKLTLQQIRALETANDEEIARKVQAEWDAEEERKRLEDLKKPKPKTISKKPTSLAQERNHMMSFLKSQGYKNVQKLRYPQMKELYDKVQESIKDSFKDFIPIGSEKEKQMLQERDAKRLLRKRKATVTEEQPSKKIKLRTETIDELRNYLRIVDFEKSAQDRESLEAISMITEFKVIDSPDGEYLMIYRANTHFRSVRSLGGRYALYGRQILHHLYLVVQDYYKHIPPTGLGLILLGDLTTIWETSATSDDDFWKNQEDWEIVRWRLNESSGVHTLELEDGTMIHMLTERRYPLSRELMIRMLDHGMEVEDESDIAITLIHLFILWTTEDGDDS